MLEHLESEEQIAGFPDSRIVWLLQFAFWIDDNYFSKKGFKWDEKVPSY